MRFIEEFLLPLEKDKLKFDARSLVYEIIKESQHNKNMAWFSHIVEDIGARDIERFRLHEAEFNSQQKNFSQILSRQSKENFQKRKQFLEEILPKLVGHVYKLSCIKAQILKITSFSAEEKKLGEVKIGNLTLHRGTLAILEQLLELSDKRIPFMYERALQARQKHMRCDFILKQWQQKDLHQKAILQRKTRDSLLGLPTGHNIQAVVEGKHKANQILSLKPLSPFSKKP